MSMRQVDNTEEKPQQNLPEKPTRQPVTLRQNATLRRSSSAPPRMGRRRRLLVEDHYRVDAETKSLLPGLPANDDDNDARDLHDFFNLIALVPVVVLNIINWDWDILIDSSKSLRQAWTGQYFPLFFAATVGYFVADLIWVVQVPTCVKSPAVIVQHHLATLVYMLIPYMHPNETGWLMGACLIVEINTWLLIARRVFNKQGFGPWVIDLSLFSIRIKLISIFFYVTWISIRCFLYPAIWRMIFSLWYENGYEEGDHFVIFSFALGLHTIFCGLNFKWTFDLFMSKFRAWKLGGNAKIEKGL
eukprot:CAMPEP_0201728024 /NCGR_PEP_ID=MMETSP0593-20130828/14517_1 /ASSEMBLY_ACC=CAM_ASM_000672 /TAXON_ID=267983 /ORGANISM="Skeletonema japonicum, Strain CCMP2506" /LENGTH=301 /DNA_ID=CAMNT_0048220005 /DNA_START=156 /DNA_END=1061 /DNA_ORIENTATION=-